MSLPSGVSTTARQDTWLQVSSALPLRPLHKEVIEDADAFLLDNKMVEERLDDPVEAVEDVMLRDLLLIRLDSVCELADVDEVCLNDEVERSLSILGILPRTTLIRVVLVLPFNTISNKKINSP